MNRAMKMLLARGGYWNEAGDSSDGASLGDTVFNDLVNEGEETPVEEEASENEETSEEDEGSEETPVDEADEGKAGEGDETEEGTEEELPEGDSEAEPPEGNDDEVADEVEEPEAGLTEEEMEAKRQEWRESLEKDFAISEEDATLLISEPESVMPRLAANLYERVMGDAAALLQQQVPAMLQAMKAQEASQDAMKKQFYTVNPGLEGADENQVTELIPIYAKAIKSTNPNLTQEELIRKVGTVIGAALGVEAGKKQEIAPPPVKGTPEPAAQPAPAPAPATVVTGVAGGESEQLDGFLSELIETTER